MEYSSSLVMVLSAHAHNHQSLLIVLRGVVVTVVSANSTLEVALEALESCINSRYFFFITPY